jgi:hypothetical protein
VLGTFSQGNCRVHEGRGTEAALIVRAGYRDRIATALRTDANIAVELEAIVSASVWFNVGLNARMMLALGIGLTAGAGIGLSLVIGLGLWVSLSIGLLCAGLSVLKHVALRLLLRLSDLAPFGYGAFLAHAKNLLILQQVGVGYIFTHVLLRDYFASLPYTSRTRTDTVSLSQR